MPIEEPPKTEPHHDREKEILKRYADGADQVVPQLCCPTDGYDAQYLDTLPQEIIEKDYGCGDPSVYVREGETVLDLGSGAGKICYILAQKVGAKGNVIGVDFNNAMLNLARKYQDEMAERLGYRNVQFHKGRIQDLALDLDAVQKWLATNPVASVEAMGELDAECARLRHEQPLIADASVDVIVSNCVLNLVLTEQKQQLFREMHRVLRRGGRAVISDIVCDEDPTPAILDDSDLWSGCIAGAFREDRFLEMFAEAGFYGIEILKRADEPWQTIDGIEFRSMTVRAFKGKEGPCLERNQAVVYRGPWRQVRDDDGHIFSRGQRMAVCDKTYRIMTDPKGPYAGEILPVPPHEEVPMEEAQTFACKSTATRHPRVTKGDDYDATTEAQDACCPPDDCC